MQEWWVQYNIWWVQGHFTIQLIPQATASGETGKKCENVYLNLFLNPKNSVGQSPFITAWLHEYIVQSADVLKCSQWLWTKHSKQSLTMEVLSTLLLLIKLCHSKVFLLTVNFEDVKSLGWLHVNNVIKLSSIQTQNLCIHIHVLNWHSKNYPHKKSFPLSTATK